MSSSSYFMQFLTEFDFTYTVFTLLQSINAEPQASPSVILAFTVTFPESDVQPSKQRIMHVTFLGMTGADSRAEQRMKHPDTSVTVSGRDDGGVFNLEQLPKQPYMFVTEEGMAGAASMLVFAKHI